MRRTSKAGECDAAQKLSRRGFVAGSALGAAALGLAGASGMTSTTGWLAPALANEETKERTATIFHMNHCEGKCTLKCTVRDGRLCMIEPQEWPNRMERTICVKALADIERIYGEGRVQVPMRRIGQRGDGAYVAISWDEALAEIQEKLGAVIKTYGPESVLLCGGSEQLTTNSLAVAMGFQGITAYAIDGNYPNGVGPATGQGFIEGDGRDLVNTRTLLNLGNNAYETALISAHVLNDARDAGCYFITVDPFLSTTAGKSDQWVPINPGCDHAFLLALIHVVVENDWTDKTFMKEHTAFPYLIESETKRIMRAEVTQADIDAAAEAAAEVAAVDEFDPASVLGKPLVWDNSLQAAVSYSEAADPALEGRFEVNGAICEPVYTHLLRQIEDYTPEWAADVTGISADTIKEIADRFANKGPSFIQCSYGGADKYSTGDIAGHAAVVLAGVTGNFGKPGSGVGIKTASSVSSVQASLGSWEVPEQLVAQSNLVDDYLLTSQPDAENVTKGIIYFGDIISYVGDFNRFKTWLDQLDFFVAIDPYCSPGTGYADLILPACTRYEDSEDVGGAQLTANHLTLKQKVIDPLFESKTDREIERELAKLFGVEDACPESGAQLVEAQFAGAEGLEGITLEAVQANGGFYEVFPDDGVPLTDFEGGVFPTATGRLEVYYEELIEFGNALPVYEPNTEIDDKELRAKYPLSNAQPRTRFHIHSEYCDAEWIRQYCDNFIEMNPADMEKRGLVDKDKVEVFNDRGYISTIVHANNAVRPGTTRMFENPWPRYMDGTILQSLTSSVLSERGSALAQGPMIPFNDTLVEVKKAGE